ncbi:MAG: hypothetical protein HY537_16455 [Deltaproteobacteria bacterium]|nr:hypothetical protein [Deltaproteobacteria bacterium]
MPTSIHASKDTKKNQQKTSECKSQLLSRGNFIIAGLGLAGAATFTWYNWPEPEQDPIKLPELKPLPEIPDFNKIPFLPGTRFRPEITLAGQDHLCPECRELYDQKKLSAQRGDFVFGVEEQYFDGNPNAVAGVDAPYAKGLVSLFVAWLHLTRNRTPTEEELLGVTLDIFTQLYENPAMKMAWAKAKRPVGKGRISRLIDEYIFVSDEKEADDFIFKQVKPLLQKDGSDVLLITLALFASYISLAEEQQAKFMAPDMSVAKEVHSIITGKRRPNKEAFPKFLEIYNNQWRNTLIARNTLHLYSRASLSGKDIVIEVGLNHIPGLYRLLKEHIDKAGVEGVALKIDSRFLDHPSYYNMDREQRERVARFVKEVQK